MATLAAPALAEGVHSQVSPQDHRGRIQHLAIKSFSCTGAIFNVGGGVWKAINSLVDGGLPLRYGCRQSLHHPNLQQGDQSRRDCLTWT